MKKIVFLLLIGFQTVNAQEELEPKIRKLDRIIDKEATIKASEGTATVLMADIKYRMVGFAYGYIQLEIDKLSISSYRGYTLNSLQDYGIEFPYEITEGNVGIKGEIHLDGLFGTVAMSKGYPKATDGIALNRKFEEFFAQQKIPAFEHAITLELDGFMDYTEAEGIGDFFKPLEWTEDWTDASIWEQYFFITTPEITYIPRIQAIELAIIKDKANKEKEEQKKAEQSDFWGGDKEEKDLVHNESVSSSKDLENTAVDQWFTVIFEDNLKWLQTEDNSCTIRGNVNTLMSIRSGTYRVNGSNRSFSIKESGQFSITLTGLKPEGNNFSIQIAEKNLDGRVYYTVQTPSSKWEGFHLIGE